MSQVQTIFKYNGAEYAFDIRDADDAEKYEKAVAVFEGEVKSNPKDGTASALIRRQCETVKRFFDNVLEVGAGIAICGGNSNLATHLDAYEAFVQMVLGQKTYITDKTNTFRQYSNRAQRRHPQNPGQNKGKHDGAPYAVK